MTKKLQQALKRVETELIVHGAGSVATPFAQFIEDLWTLVSHIKKEKRRKRD